MRPLADSMIVPACCVSSGSVGRDHAPIDHELVHQVMNSGDEALVIEGADIVDADASTRSQRCPLVRYRRGEHGELQHDAAPNRREPRIVDGLGDEILNDQLVKC